MERGFFFRGGKEGRQTIKRERERERERERRRLNKESSISGNSVDGQVSSKR